MVCIKCNMEITYHAYRGVAAKRWTTFSKGETIGPLCLTCYCELTAEKALRAERIKEVIQEDLQKRDYIIELLTRIFIKTQRSACEIARILKVSPHTLSKWRCRICRPSKENIARIEALAKERGVTI